MAKLKQFTIPLMVLLSALLLFGGFEGCFGKPSWESALRTWRTGDLHKRGDVLLSIWPQRKTIIGKTKAEVVTLLGAPNREKADAIEYDAISSIPLPYSEWRDLIVIEFDPSGKAKDITAIP